MSDLSEVYDGIRKDVSDLLRGLSPEELATKVPATPDWTVRDVASHLAADATCTIAADFPRAFFENFGAPEGVIELNAWTQKQIEERRDRPLEDVLEEWEKSTLTLTAMIRGETPWPEPVPFPERILITDATVHQHDLYGALGREGDRESAGVRLASSGYIAMVGFRLAQGGAGCLRFDSGNKQWTVGGEEPDATVRASRFEFFRALSGRRNPDQVRAYEWEGDPEPFIPYFYPYGVREDALHE